MLSLTPKAPFLSPVTFSHCCWPCCKWPRACLSLWLSVMIARAVARAANNTLQTRIATPLDKHTRHDDTHTSKVNKLKRELAQRLRDKTTKEVAKARVTNAGLKAQRQYMARVSPLRPPVMSIAHVQRCNFTHQPSATPRLIPQPLSLLSQGVEAVHNQSESVSSSLSTAAVSPIHIRARAHTPLSQLLFSSCQTCYAMPNRRRAPTDAAPARGGRCS